MAAKNSSSRANWVVKSSLSRHILILPCESPVATVWRLEKKKKQTYKENQIQKLKVGKSH